MQKMLNYAKQHDRDVIETTAVDDNNPKIDLTDEGLTTEPSFAYPLGLEKAYEYYLAYDNHPQYWDGLMRYLWNAYPNFRKDYHQCYENFTMGFKAHLLKHKEQIHAIA